MVLLTAAALLVGGVLTYFTIGAVATLAHWIAVAGGLAVFAGVTYNLIENDYLSFFDGELFKVLTAGLVGSLTGFVSYRLFESVFASLGFAAALVAIVLIGASIVFSPALVAGLLGNVLGGVLEALGGE